MDTEDLISVSARVTRCANSFGFEDLSDSEIGLHSTDIVSVTSTLGFDCVTRRTRHALSPDDGH